MRAYIKHIMCIHMHTHGAYTVHTLSVYWCGWKVHSDNESGNTRPGIYIAIDDRDD